MTIRAIEKEEIDPVKMDSAYVLLKYVGSKWITYVRITNVLIYPYLMLNVIRKLVIRCREEFWELLMRLAAKMRIKPKTYKIATTKASSVLLVAVL